MRNLFLHSGNVGVTGEKEGNPLNISSPYTMFKFPQIYTYMSMYRLFFKLNSLSQLTYSYYWHKWSYILVTVLNIYYGKSSSASVQKKYLST